MWPNPQETKEIWTHLLNKSLMENFIFFVQWICRHQHHFVGFTFKGILAVNSLTGWKYLTRSFYFFTLQFLFKEGMKKKDNKSSKLEPLTFKKGYILWFVKKKLTDHRDKYKSS